MPFGIDSPMEKGCGGWVGGDLECDPAWS